MVETGSVAKSLIASTADGDGSGIDTWDTIVGSMSGATSVVVGGALLRAEPFTAEESSFPVFEAVASDTSWTSCFSSPG